MKDYIFGGLSLLLVGLLFFAGKPDYEPMASNLLTKTWALDTITNAANDTLLMPWTMQNRYTGALQITRTNISGTTNLAITVQTNVASTSSTDETWNTVLTSAGTGATAELSDAGRNLRATIPNNRGRHRHTVQFLPIKLAWQKDAELKRNRKTRIKAGRVL
jgi:hypothetical protein